MNTTMENTSLQVNVLNSHTQNSIQAKVDVYIQQIVLNVPSIVSVNNVIDTVASGTC